VSTEGEAEKERADRWGVEEEGEEEEEVEDGVEAADEVFELRCDTTLFTRRSAF
jgi:hypothetical protein